jgi:hypothetical protein
MEVRFLRAPPIKKEVRKMLLFVSIFVLVILCIGGVAFLVYKAVKSKKVQKVVAQVDSTVKTVEQTATQAVSDIKKV